MKIVSFFDEIPSYAALAHITLCCSLLALSTILPKELIYTAIVILSCIALYQIRSYASWKSYLVAFFAGTAISVCDIYSTFFEGTRLDYSLFNGGELNWIVKSSFSPANAWFFFLSFFLLKVAALQFLFAEIYLAYKRRLANPEVRNSSKISYSQISFIGTEVRLQNEIKKAYVLSYFQYLLNFGKRNEFCLPQTIDDFDYSCYRHGLLFQAIAIAVFFTVVPIGNLIGRYIGTSFFGLPYLGFLAFLILLCIFSQRIDLILLQLKARKTKNE